MASPTAQHVTKDINAVALMTETSTENGRYKDQKGDSIDIDGNGIRYADIINTNKNGYLSPAYYKEHISMSMENFNRAYDLRSNSRDPYAMIPLPLLELPRIQFCGSFNLNSRFLGGSEANSRYGGVKRSTVSGSYENICQNSDPPRGSLTFEEWLMLKKQQEAERKADMRAEEIRYRQDLAARRSLSAKKYDEWLHKKIRQQQQQSKATSAASSHAGSSFEPYNSSRRNTRAQYTEEEIKRHLHEWEQRKIVQLERQREQKRHEEELKREQAVIRRAMAQEAWERWLAAVDGRPYVDIENEDYDSIPEGYVDTSEKKDSSEEQEQQQQQR